MYRSSSPTTTTKTEQENEALAHSFCTEIFQKTNFSLADEILTPDFILRNPVLPSELTHGPEGVKKFASLVVARLDIKSHTMIQYPKEIRY